MGRPRTKDKHLPPGVYHKHGAYYLVRRGKWIPLGKHLPAALALYGRLVQGQAGGMADLLSRWFLQARKANGEPLSSGTRKNYAQAVKTLSAMMANLAPHEVRALDVAAVKRELRETPGVANQCLGVLRMAFSYALENGEAEINPATGIKPFHGKTRERLLTPEEFAHIRAHASPRLALMLDLMFLTGQRVMDVVNIRMSDVTADGIHFRQQKTGKRLTVGWTPELREAVEECKRIQPVRTLFLFTSRDRKPPSYKTVYEDWTSAIQASGVKDTQMRDLRPFAITTAEEQGHDPQALAGHTSRAMTERYLRARKTRVVAGPTMKRKA